MLKRLRWQADALDFMNSVQGHTAASKRRQGGTGGLVGHTMDVRSIGVSYAVHAFYYPWYGALQVDGRWHHWDHSFIPHWDKRIAARWPTGRHKPPDDIGASFYPALGPYSSSDEAVMASHMQQVVTSAHACSSFCTTIRVRAQVAECARPLLSIEQWLLA